MQGLTGFGGSVLAVPLLSLFMDLQTVVVIVPIVSLMISIIMCVYSKKDIVWKYVARIALMIGLGLPVGIYAINFIHGDILKISLGIILILISICNLYKLYISHKSARKIKSEKLAKAIDTSVLLSCGIVHGAFASGGPFLIVYGSNKFESIEKMRTTFAAVWVVINTVMLITNIALGNITREVLTKSALTIPLLIISVLIGYFVANKISKKVFFTIIYALLIIAGVFMFI